MNGKCENIVGSYTCLCDEGFSGTIYKKRFYVVSQIEYILNSYIVKIIITYNWFDIIEWEITTFVYNCSLHNFFSISMEKGVKERKKKKDNRV